MSVELLEDAAAALGDLSDEVVFLGAASLSLWITDPAAPVLRPTVDVDVVVDVTSLIEYNRFEARMREAGFRDEGTVLGRFLFPPRGLQLDVIPADASILGFVNHWQRRSLPAAVARTLPSGTEIRALPPANLLATKLEAFSARGGGDFMASADFEDIVALIDGRKELGAEVLEATQDLRTYVATELADYLDDPRAREAMVAHLERGQEGRARAEAVLFPRCEELARTSSNS